MRPELRIVHWVELYRLFRSASMQTGYLCKFLPRRTNRERDEAISDTKKRFTELYARRVPLLIALLSPPPANTPANYDGRRAVKIVQELASRSLGMLPSAGAGSGDTKIVKDAILDLLSPFGDPALNVPESTLLEIDSKCRELEACNQKKGRAAIAAIEGIWKVRFSDAPPPSNGALGPLRGRASRWLTWLPNLTQMN